jgi:hypothetical protein
MPSYKIHSLKDSNKLSFIIEWESENSIKQKLSSEGYIVLSVEKTEVDISKIFVFEGRKPDKSFIEGKIEAENLFVAYEMLKNSYNYTISKLYPSSLSDPLEREKIFQELLSTFEEKKSTQKTTVDTAGKTLLKNKSFIEKVRNGLQSHDIAGKDILIADLKKLEFINNNATIRQSLESIMRDLLSKTRTTPDVYNVFKTIAQEMGMFLPPEMYFSFLDRAQRFFNFLKPALTTNPSLEKYHPLSWGHMEYGPIATNPHIKTLISKKYQQSTWWMAKEDQKQAYLYSHFRSRWWLYRLWMALLWMGMWVRYSLLFLLMGFITLGVFIHTREVFVPASVCVIFLLFISVSLVIPDETV